MAGLKDFVLRKCHFGSCIGCIRHLTPLPCLELVNKCGGWLVVGGWWVSLKEAKGTFLIPAKMTLMNSTSSFV